MPDLSPNQKALETALTRHRAGALAEARTLYGEILAIDPKNPQALHLLGVVHLQLGQAEQALTLIDQAIDVKNDDPQFHNNRANALLALGNREGAIVALRRAMDLQPDFIQAAHNLGTLLQQTGRSEEAIAHLKVAAAADHGGWETPCNLGNAYVALRRYEEAVSAFRLALRAKPNDPPLLTSLAQALLLSHQAQEALSMADLAIASQPEFAPAHLNRSNALMELWDVPEALQSLKRAASLDPTLDGVGSKLLFVLNYLEEDPTLLSQAHINWGRTLEQAKKGVLKRDANADRQLKIGYLSRDLAGHSVGIFMLPIIRRHDRSRFEITCYSYIEHPDPVTDLFKAATDHWCDCSHWDDDHLERQIRDDGIDILVDLAGHTSAHKLALFARRPAPVQVSYLGYPGTTGLKAMDFRIVDGVVEPEGYADDLSEEKIYRLEGGFHCFVPFEAGSDPTPEPPAVKNGFITFGSFNNLAKVGPKVIALWARLLGNCPDSRLLLKDFRLKNPVIVRKVEDQFAAHGIDAARLMLLGSLGERQDHLAAYGMLDIALDPFPYNGTTTTCEALWMGVPTITLKGRVHASRVGASLLGQVGLNSLVTNSEDAFLRTAKELSEDLVRLGELRQTLRSRLQRSQLGDPTLFIPQLEAAYRAMWRQTHDG